MSMGRSTSGDFGARYGHCVHDRHASGDASVAGERSDGYAADRVDGKPLASAFEAQRLRLMPIGTGPIGWATECNGKIWHTGPCLEVLGAWLEMRSLQAPRATMPMNSPR
jgi:hypothetical protein